MSKIPDFTKEGLLPPGIHWATWDEILERFGINALRRQLLDGFKGALDCLKMAGCHIVYLDGSFVTIKKYPNDYDGCWEPSGVDGRTLQILEPCLLDLSNGRKAQKMKFLGELFPNVEMSYPPGKKYLEFFQTDRETGIIKGIIGIQLEDF